MWEDKAVHSLVFVNYLALAALLCSPLLAWAFEEHWQLPSREAFQLLVLLASLAALGETLLAVGLKMETAAKATSMNYLQACLPLGGDLKA